MNGKGSTPRPFSTEYDEYAQIALKTLKNPKDLYREAVMQPDFFNEYPDLTGNWGLDRETWENIIKERYRRHRDY